METLHYLQLANLINKIKYINICKIFIQRFDVFFLNLFITRKLVCIFDQLVKKMFEMINVRTFLYTRD